MIKVVLPGQLRRLAELEGEIVELEVEGEATMTAVLDALERRHPALRGTIRDLTTSARRPKLRFFACGADWSFEPLDAVLPERVRLGQEPLLVVGAISGG